MKTAEEIYEENLRLLMIATEGMTREGLVRMVADLAENEQNLRKQLDDLRNIVR